MLTSVTVRNGNLSRLTSSVSEKGRVANVQMGVASAQSDVDAVVVAILNATVCVHGKMHR